MADTGLGSVRVVEVRVGLEDGKKEIAVDEVLIYIWPVD